MDYKKTIAALAVAATATVATAEIVSSSVVGYQNQGFATSGYSISAATFVPVSGDRDEMTLGEIKVNDDFVSSYISFLTTGGATAKVSFGGKTVSANYCYWFAGDDPGDGEGWYLVADEDATVNQNNVSIPFGTGYMVFRMGDEPDAGLVYAGAVDTTPVTKGFANSGYSICGNCSPVDLTIGDITVNDDFVSSYISFLTTGGATAKVTFGGKPVSANYTYWTAGDDPGDGAGWYLVADEDATVNQNDAVSLAAGQGFLVFRMGDEPDATITVPAAL